MTQQEQIDVSNLARLRAINAILISIESARLEDDSICLDVGIPLRKWIERLHASLALQVEQEAKNWRRGEDERNRLRALLEQWDKNCTGRHGSQSPCGLTADHEVAPERVNSETGVKP